MPNVWLALGRGPGCAVLDLDLGDLDLGDLDLGDLDLGDLDQLRDSLADCLFIKQQTNKTRIHAVSTLTSRVARASWSRSGDNKTAGFSVKYLYSFASGACYSDT